MIYKKNVCSSLDFLQIILCFLFFPTSPRCIQPALVRHTSIPTVRVLFTLFTDVYLRSGTFLHSTVEKSNTSPHNRQSTHWKYRKHQKPCRNWGPLWPQEKPISRIEITNRIQLLLWNRCILRLIIMQYREVFGSGVILLFFIVRNFDSCQKKRTWCIKSHVIWCKMRN